jgi:LacI family transcriptional regulator
MSITQAQIAKELGVNQRTISVAFGSSGRISDEMRQKVLETAQKMGYRPNRLAAGLRGAKTNSIGIIWHFADTWSGDANIALSILKHVQNNGYQVYQAQLPLQTHHICKQIDEMLARRVDALIIHGISPQLSDPEILKRLEQMPAVVAICPEPIEGFPGDLVVLDRHQAVRQVVDYFASRGRKKPIFVIDVDQLYNPSKYQAFIQQCQKHGIAHDDMLLSHGQVVDPDQMGEQHLQAFKNRYPNDLQGVDAVFTFNDIGALYIMRELQARMIEVPRQVAVVGFNDIEAGRIWKPALASGNRKRHEVAEAVNRMLDARLADPGIQPQTRTIHMELIMRESAG